MRTQLDLIISSDDTHLVLNDASLYNKDVPVTSPIYRVTIPNFNMYVDLEYIPSTVLNVNSNLLLLTNSPNLDGLCPLPDGIYKIRQSVCPNDVIFRDYSYFKGDTLFRKISDFVCCNSNDSSALEKVYDVIMGLEMAKHYTQCGDDKSANISYSTALALLNSLNSCC